MPMQKVKVSSVVLSGSFREQIDEDHAASFADKLKRGVYFPPPVVAREGDHFTLLSGEHRLHGYVLAGKAEMDVMVQDGPLSPLEATLEALRENVHRLDFNPRELTGGIVALMKQGMTQEQVAEALNISPAKVSKLLTISRKLAPDLQDLVAAGKLEPSKAFILSPLPHEQQRELAALDLKRDALGRKVKTLLGKVAKRNRKLRFKTQRMELAASCSMDELLKELLGTAKAVRKCLRLGLGPESLPGLLAG